MKIILVVGARSNFMKIAPFTKAIHEYNNLRYLLQESQSIINGGEIRNR